MDHGWKRHRGHLRGSLRRRRRAEPVALELRRDRHTAVEPTPPWEPPQTAADALAGHGRHSGRRLHAPIRVGPGRTGSAPAYAHVSESGEELHAQDPTAATRCVDDRRPVPVRLRRRRGGGRRSGAARRSRARRRMSAPARRAVRTTAWTRPNPSTLTRTPTPTTDHWAGPRPSRRWAGARTTGGQRLVPTSSTS